MITAPTEFLTVLDIHELILDMPLSDIVRELEVVEQRDYEQFKIIARFFRTASERTAPRGYQQYDREGDEE